MNLEKNVKQRIELPEEDELFVSSHLQSFREQVQEHGAEGIGAHAIYSSAVSCQQTESRSEGDGHLRRVSDEQGLELSFDMSRKDLVTFATKPDASRNLIASTIRKRGEVKLRQLDRKSRTEFEVATSAEIQSWLRYEAVTAALRLQHHHRDKMKMRWVFRYIKSGKPNARLVINGYHDPRVSSEVRTEAPVASSRGRSVFFMATAHNQFSFEKGHVKNAFLQGTTMWHLLNSLPYQFLSCAKR